MKTRTLLLVAVLGLFPALSGAQVAGDYLFQKKKATSGFSSVWLTPDPWTIIGFNGSGALVTIPQASFDAAGAAAAAEASAAAYTDAQIAAHVHDASEITTGEFADARISPQSVVQHEGSLTIGWAQLTGVPASFPPDAHTHALDDLSDVNAPAPASGEVLKWNGTAWAPATDNTGGGGATDHGALTGLADDDHTQYHTDARGDARYPQLTGSYSDPAWLTAINYAKIIDLPASFPPDAHTHVSADVTDATSAGAGAADAGKLIEISDIGGFALDGDDGGNLVTIGNAGTGAAIRGYSQDGYGIVGESENSSGAYIASSSTTAPALHVNGLGLTGEPDIALFHNDGEVGMEVQNDASLKWTSATGAANTRSNLGLGTLATQDGTFSGTHSGTSSGTNTGDVTLAGTPDYITISGQTITRGQVDLGTDVTSRLPFANLVQGTAGSLLIGTRSTGPGDFQEITLGAGLTMSSTTLSATATGTNTGDQTITNSSDATSHTVTLSASGGSVQLIEGSNITLTTGGTASAGTVTIAATSSGVSDGDKGDITVSGSGATWNIDAGVVGTAELGGDITAAGEALLDDANAAAQRTTLGLGTAATVNTGTGSGDVPTITNADARYARSDKAAMTFTVYTNWGTNTTWTNMPAAITWIGSPGASRPYFPIDLTRFTEAKVTVLMAGTAGASGSKIRVVYISARDNTVGNWLQLGSSAQVEATIDAANTETTSGWVSLATLAKAEVWVGVAGISGDGAADPVIQNVWVQFR